MNRIFYIMGKSSSGKDTIYKRLLNDMELTPIVLHTTRPMRENEKQGREYHFVDRQCYEEMKSAGKVVESRIYNTVHGEWIYFTSRDSIDLENGNCLGIGTLESYVEIKATLGEAVVPIYIEVEDGLRLMRAIQREQLEPSPRYAELCRRFLADSEDFSDEKLKSAGIKKRFSNNGAIEDCISEIKSEMKTWKE
ncbi:MAG: guanylate kinase [Ruminococcus sp.]|nr:guanylate kinase [Ruminococcus sp.]